MDQEDHQGGRLGINSWADTVCAGRHAYVEESVVDKLIMVSGFTPELGTLPDLPVDNVLYAYDSKDEIIILESNNTIYLSDKM